MHISWLYSTTGISGYAIASQYAVRNGRSRRLRNALNCIKTTLPSMDALGDPGGLDMLLVMAILAIVIKLTEPLAKEMKPDAARPKSRSKDLHIVIRIRPKKSENEKRRCKGCKCHDLAFRKGEYRTVRSLDFGRVKVFIEVEVRRIRCKLCGKMFDEKLPFLTSPKARVTRAFEWQMV